MIAEGSKVEYRLSSCQQGSPGAGLSEIARGNPQSWLVQAGESRRIPTESDDRTPGGQQSRDQRPAKKARGAGDQGQSAQSDSMGATKS